MHVRGGVMCQRIHWRDVLSAGCVIVLLAGCGGSSGGNGGSDAGAQGGGSFSISGTARDEVGAPEANVAVTLAGKASSTITTTADGSFSFDGLPNGPYTL